MLVLSSGALPFCSAMLCRTRTNCAAENPSATPRRRSRDAKGASSNGTTYSQGSKLSGPLQVATSCSGSTNINESVQLKQNTDHYWKLHCSILVSVRVQVRHLKATLSMAVKPAPVQMTGASASKLTMPCSSAADATLSACRLVTHDSWIQAKVALHATLHASSQH